LCVATTILIGILAGGRTISEAMARGQPERIGNGAAHAHLARSGFVVVVESEGNFGELHTAEVVELEQDFDHTSKALLGDEPVAESVVGALQDFPAIGAKPARIVAHSAHREHHLKEHAHHAAVKAAYGGHAIYFCAGLKARRDHDVRPGFELSEHR